MLSQLQAKEVRRRLFNPSHAVPDRPLEMRNGRPIVVYLEKPPAIIHPLPGVSHETFLARGRHEGCAILRGQRARTIQRDEAPCHVSVAAIVTEAALHFRVTTNDIISARRTQDVVRPRQVVAYLARHMTKLSMPVIGKHLGGRDHTTILAAIRQVDRLMGRDADFAERVDEVRRRVLESIED